MYEDLDGPNYPIDGGFQVFLPLIYLLVIPLIAQSVFAEAVFFSFQGLWFTVRARALASFLSGVVAMFAGNVLGAFIDRKKWSERKAL